MYDSFEWDLQKRLTNLEKHGIDFEDAIRIFKSSDLHIARPTRHSA